MAILKMILIIVFLIAAFAITVVVLLQEGKSAGLGSIGGAANSDSYWDKNKKHTLEGKFERWTKIMAGVFVLAAFILMLMPNNTNASNAQIVQPSASASVEATDNAGASTAPTTEATDNADASASPSAEPSASPAQ